MQIPSIRCKCDIIRASNNPLIDRICPEHGAWPAKGRSKNGMISSNIVMNGLLCKCPGPAWSGKYCVRHSESTSYEINKAKQKLKRSK